MECSKCRSVKDRSCFYASGKVCKDCKRNYSRTYRSSRTADARSWATNDDASVRSVDDYQQAKEGAIAERLDKIETDIDGLRATVCREMEASRADMHQTVGGILERLRMIDEALARLDSRMSTARRVSINSHPIADFA